MHGTEEKLLNFSSYLKNYVLPIVFAVKPKLKQILNLITWIAIIKNCYTNDMVTHRIC